MLNSVVAKTTFNNSHNIRLYNSDISRFRLNYAYFKLLTIDDEGRELPRDQAISMYEMLLKNFNDHGQKESFEKLDIEYQQYKWRTNKWYLRWIGPLSKAWWNFGYSKELIFGWAAVLLMAFTFLTLSMLQFLQTKIYSMKAISKKEAGNGRPYHGFKKLWYSFVYSANLFFRLTLKTEEIEFDSKPRNIVGTIYILIVYVTGIICLAYMANFVLQH